MKLPPGYKERYMAGSDVKHAVPDSGPQRAACGMHPGARGFRGYWYGGTPVEDRIMANKRDCRKCVLALARL